jgi:hypothetical protein
MQQWRLNDGLTFIAKWGKLWPRSLCSYFIEAFNVAYQRLVRLPPAAESGATPLHMACVGRATLPDFFELLGLDQGCSQSEIKKAYLAKALLLHPDKQKPEVNNYILV